MSLYNPKPTKKVTPSRHSGGTSGKLSIKGHKTQTPVVPYVASEPSHIPGIAGATKESAAVVLARQAKRVQRARALQLLPKNGGTAGRQTQDVAPNRSRLKHSAPSHTPLPAEPGSKPIPTSQLPRIKAAVKAAAREFNAEGGKQVPVPGVKVKAHTRKAPVFRSANPDQNPASAVISSKPRPPVKRAERKEAARKLHRATKALQHSGPNLAKLEPGIKREVARLEVQAHKKYPDVPISVMMGDTEQESNFDPAAVSSSSAVGLTQFIPSTAATYGVKEGTGKAEKRSQVFGQAKLLHNLQHEHPGGIKEALGNYYGDPSASYSSEVLEKAKKYSFLDKPGNPKAVRNYQAAVKNAESLGIKVPKNATPSPPSKQVVSRYKAGMAAAKELAHAHIPYPTPDQHFGLQASPAALDCSAAVSWVLNKMGVLNTELVSGEMGKVLAPGPGAVTVYYNAGHTFMSFGNRFFGTSVNDSSKGLSFYKNPGSSYLSQYQVGHIKGLGVPQAIQLGLVVPGGGLPSNGPDIQFSNGGSTATVTGGSTLNQPGFSNAPIKLTQRQRVARTKKKLAQVGIGGEEAPEYTPKSEAEKTLSALKRKYGVA